MSDFLWEWVQCMKPIFRGPLTILETRMDGESVSYFLFLLLLFLQSLPVLNALYVCANKE